MFIFSPSFPPFDPMKVGEKWGYPTNIGDPSIPLKYYSGILRFWGSIVALVLIMSDPHLSVFYLLLGRQTHLDATSSIPWQYWSGIFDCAKKGEKGRRLHRRDVLYMYSYLLLRTSFALRCSGKKTALKYHCSTITTKKPY